MGAINFTNFFPRSKENPEENPKLSKNSDDPRKSFLCRQFSNDPDPGKSLRKMKITLETNKPLDGVELALANLKILKNTTETLVSRLKSLVNEADIALKNAKRPHCYVCTNKRCLLEDEICLSEFESFDKLIRAGGPMCALQTMKGWEKFNNPFTGESTTAQCQPTYEHDHLHITNHHRLLLENMQLELESIQILYRQVKYPNWSHCTELGKFHKNKRKSSQVIVDFTDFYKVKREYEWVWGSGWSIESWSEIQDACRAVLELQVIGIDEFDKRILIYSAAHGSADQLSKFRKKVSVTYNPYIMPTTPWIKPQKSFLEQRCCWCVGDNLPKSGARRVGEEKEKMINTLGVKALVEDDLRGSYTAMNFRTLEGTLAKPKESIARKRKRKGKKEKHTSEVIVSTGEERELYNITQPPRCMSCELWIESVEIFGEAGRRMKAKFEAKEIYAEAVRCVGEVNEYDEVFGTEAGTSV